MNSVVSIGDGQDTKTIDASSRATGTVNNPTYGAGSDTKWMCE